MGRSGNPARRVRPPRMAGALAADSAAPVASTRKPSTTLPEAADVSRILKQSTTDRQQWTALGQGAALRFGGSDRTAMVCLETPANRVRRDEIPPMLLRIAIVDEAEMSTILAAKTGGGPASSIPLARVQSFNAARSGGCYCWMDSTLREVIEDVFVSAILSLTVIPPQPPNPRKERAFFLLPHKKAVEALGNAVDIYVAHVAEAEEKELAFVSVVKVGSRLRLDQLDTVDTVSLSGLAKSAKFAPGDVLLFCGVPDVPADDAAAAAGGVASSTTTADAPPHPAVEVDASEDAPAATSSAGDAADPAAAETAAVANSTDEPAAASAD